VRTTRPQVSPVIGLDGVGDAPMDAAQRHEAGDSAGRMVTWRDLKRFSTMKATPARTPYRGFDFR